MSLKLVRRAAEALTTGTPKAQVQSIRTKRIELMEQKKTVEGSRRPLEESEAALGRMLDEIAAGLDIDLSALSDHRARGLPEILRPGNEIGLRLNDKTLLALLVSANRSGVRDALTKQLRVGYDSIGTLTVADREAKLAQIDVELDRLERDEERIIRASEADGSPLLRREDADPGVVLLADIAAL